YPSTSVIYTLSLHDALPIYMATAAFLVSSLLVVGTAAWHLFKGRRDELVKKSFSMGLWMVLVTSCLQVVIGDQHGLNTLEHQPRSEEHTSELQSRENLVCRL